MYRYRIFGILLLFSVFIHAAYAASVHEDPLDRETYEIASQLRCTVCQSQSLSESNADLAKDMRALIRQQLQQGKSKDEIISYFVQRYGDYILLKPPLDNLGTLLWVAPFALFVLLGGGAYFFIRQRSRTGSIAPTLSPDDQARVRAAREQR